MRFSQMWFGRGDPGTVRSRVLDPAFRMSGFDREGARAASLSVEQDEATAVVHVIREMPTGADAMAASVIGRYLTLVQTERWHPVDVDGGVRAQVHIECPAHPITVRLDLRVRPTADGCTHAVEGDAVVGFPVVGRLVERRVVRGVLSSLTAQWPDASTA